MKISGVRDLVDPKTSDWLPGAGYWLDLDERKTTQRNL